MGKSTFFLVAKDNLQKFSSTDDLRRSIASLKEELDALTGQREFLLSQAIPKLEHEYLYCISVLEHEASTLEAELFRLSAIVTFYESALRNGVMPDNGDLSRLISSITDEWNTKSHRRKYSSSDDQSIIPVLQYERDEISALFHRILKYISSSRVSDGTDHYTYLLRRVSESYRAGNIGELRALRIIIEGKIAHRDTRRKKPSPVKILREFMTYTFLVLSHKFFPKRPSENENRQL